MTIIIVIQNIMIIIPGINIREVQDKMLWELVGFNWDRVEKTPWDRDDIGTDLRGKVEFGSQMGKDQCRWRELDKQRSGSMDVYAGVERHLSKWGFPWWSPATAGGILKKKIPNDHIYNILWGKVLRLQLSALHFWSSNQESIWCYRKKIKTYLWVYANELPTE